MQLKKILLLILLLTTGCRSKIICTGINTSEELEITEQTEITHTLNKIEQIENKVTYIIKDEALNDGFNNIFQSVKEKYNDENIEKQENIEDNKYELKIKYNPRKLNKEMLEKLNKPLKVRQYIKHLNQEKMKCE